MAESDHVTRTLTSDWSREGARARHWTAVETWTWAISAEISVHESESGD